MIETEQAITIDVGIDRIWESVHDIGRWAALMPGFRDYELIDDDTSLWTLKVGVGALVRTVKVRVHVDRWDGPGHVAFSFALEGDPVDGDGTYDARANEAGGTDIALQVHVRGSGSMAPMWEAMGRPLLPKLARNFAAELKARIEADAGVTVAQEEAAAAAPSSLFAKLKRTIGAAPEQ